MHGPGELGQALRSSEGAPLGQVYAFLSSLYFRGKLTYATRFGAPLLPSPSTLVITPGHGLCRASTPVRVAELTAISRVEVDADNPAFAEPLRRDAALLASALPAQVEVVLLGSIATSKYVDPLLSVFGERLLFPSDFVGRGDMSRGGMLLRAARAGHELSYTPVLTSPRSGRRATRLSELRRHDP